MNPKVTLMVFIHPPDFGAFFSHVGNMAKSVKGNARARANPNIPMAGPMILPLVVSSTSRKPMMGPVQEKLTNERVKAMRKIERSPLVLLALLSTLFVHEEGKVSSNQPKKLSANTTSSRQKKMLKMAFVERAFRALAPKMAVMARPSAR